jgi:signal transduction histidine kinase
LKPTIPFFKSIQFKATLLLFTVFFSVIVPVNWVIFQKIKSTIDEVDSKELKAETEKLLANVRFSPITIPLPPTGYLLKLQVRKELEYENTFTSPGFPNLTPTDHLAELVYVDTLKISTIEKLIDGAGSAVLVSLARSNTKSTKQIAEIKSYLLAANLLSLILAGTLLFLFAERLIRPIKKIILTASQITASKSIERVPTPRTQDESKLLADTLNEMLSRIEQSIKNQVNFFASAAHELKTPLAVMQTEIGISMQQADAATQLILRNQLTEVERLTRIIHDFLLISQLKSETLTLRKKEEQIEEVIYAALKKVKYLIKDKASHLQVTIGDGIAVASIEIDFDKIETVVCNLIENAVKYSPANSNIDIIVKIQTNTIQIIIRNSISAPIKNFELLKNEFEKSEPLSSGLGMGLWICDQIIKLHNGKLELACKNSQFIATIELPIQNQIEI